MEEVEAIITKISEFEALISTDENKYKETAKEYQKKAVEEHIAIRKKNFQSRSSKFEINIFSPSIIKRAREDSPLKRNIQEVSSALEAEFKMENRFEIERYKIEVKMSLYMKELIHFKYLL